MNLNSTYNFLLNQYNFYFEINWEFNLLYLENFNKHGQIYIDSSFYINLENGFSLYIAGEEDYGNLLDFINTILNDNNKNELNFESFTTKVSKDNNMLNIKFKKNNILISGMGNNEENINIEFSNELYAVLNSLKLKIQDDYRKISSNLDLIKNICFKTDAD